MRRAGEAGIALSGLALLRHPDAGPRRRPCDGVVVSFGAPAEHAFGAAVDALCGVLASKAARPSPVLEALPLGDAILSQHLAPDLAASCSESGE